MSLITDFAAHLAAAVPSAQIRPLVNTAAVFPSIVYEVNGNLRQQFYTGSAGMRTTNIVLNVYSTTYSGLQTIKDTLSTTYHGFTGVMGSTTISKIIISAQFETMETTTDDALYRCILDLDIID